ncbi:unnamed protein product [Dovyalis caffra]|uniref:Uncharacterized protein n=1 Tax=Dovyalis caffra TaxID=77055 RepID=A0AAV1S6U5_9ROSI|nr:unnamed protein product [Dovyalis caffra]
MKEEFCADCSVQVKPKCKQGYTFNTLKAFNDPLLTIKKRKSEDLREQTSIPSASCGWQLTINSESSSELSSPALRFLGCFDATLESVAFVLVEDTAESGVFFVTVAD